MLLTQRLQKTDSGFTIVEMAIVLLIVGLLAGIILPLTSNMQEQQKRSETINKLTAVDQALLSYVVTNKRLPCPANGSLASGAANAGVSQPNGAGDCTAQNQGVVPWATLGLSESDATDAWGTRITYRVPTLAIGFTRANALDATRCDPAGGAPIVPGGAATPVTCNTGCTAANLAACTSPLNFMIGRGLMVFDEATIPINNPVVGTGAAYILISHGAFGGGGYNNAGGPATLGSATPAGTSEAFNQNNNPIRLSPNGYYHGSQQIEVANNTHFDDIVSHPTIMSLLIKAQLGPRVQP